jgi:isoquinoline 1-oxidoreductase subunit beta
MTTSKMTTSNITAHGNAAKPSRRAFLIGAGAVGGFTLGFHIPDVRAQKTAEIGPLVASGNTEVNAWVVIKPDDTCLIRIVRSEMGQGTITGLAQLVAEELECDWNKIKYEYPTPGQSHARKRVWGEMSTGGSRGIRMSHDIVRRGGAAARMMLLDAAAQGWKVPVNELTVSDGIITHAASKRTISYGKVAAAAAKLTPPDPKTITLKDPKNWKVAGKPLRRLDTADKLNGSKKYTVDLNLPGMLNAAIKAAPVHGNKIASYDDAKVLGMAGVKKVVKVDDNTVAVVADTWWHAKKAMDALPIVYTESANDKVSSATIAAHLKEGLEPNAPNSYAGNKNGDVAAALASAAKRIEATYSSPFLAHATMEPMTCAAKYTAERAEIWVPTQNGEASHAALAEASGLPLDKCEVYKMDLGGGFGRRGGTQDYVRQATVIAKAMPGTPIKLIWSREEDMAHDFYRPISMAKMSAGLDANGNLTALQMRISGQSINAWLAPAAIKNGNDDRQLQGLLNTTPDNLYGYTVPNLSIEYAMRNTHVPVGPWRGVNTNQNGVYSECFMDEIAKAAGKDPLEFRRALMAKHPKHLAVLNAAAEKGDWGKPLPAGRHRGIAQFMGYGSYSAAVAEVSVSAQGKLKVHRLVLALNCGHVVNPDQVAAQVEGSVAYGLTATMYGEVKVKDGRMVEQNFDTYEILRLAEMPAVETVTVPTGDFWGGVGEPTICVTAPAVLNALFAATGKPARDLPLKNLKLV